MGQIKHPGPSTFRLSKKKLIGNFNQIMGVTPMKKPRVRPSGMKYDNPEAKIRTEIIKELRKKGCFVRRLEPATRGSFGVSDLLVVNPKRVLLAFVEVKAPKSQLSGDQHQFRMLCELCKVNYIVVRSVAQAKEELL